MFAYPIGRRRWGRLQGRRSQSWVDVGGRGGGIGEKSSARGEEDRFVTVVGVLVVGLRASEIDNHASGSGKKGRRKKMEGGNRTLPHHPHPLPLLSPRQMPHISWAQHRFNAASPSVSDFPVWLSDSS